MTSLLQDPLYEAQKQAPSPSKDLHHIIVTQKEITLTSLIVSLRPQHMDSRPKVIKKSHSDFLKDEAEALREKIKIVFGMGILEYITNICRGHCDFLIRIPDKLKMNILSYLHEDDIDHVADTCQCFYKLCNSTNFWDEIQLIKDQRAAYIEHLSKPIPNYDSKRPLPLWMIRRKYSNPYW